MRIVAIETSGRSGSLALLEAETDALVVADVTLPADRRTAQALSPALKSLLSGAGWPAASIGLVAVAVGPGSFTGLRIGVTAAKTLAYATGAEVVGVNTLAVLAAQAPAEPSPLWTILDAQRQELFVAKFESTGSARPALGSHAETSIIPWDDWLAGLAAGDRVTGPPLAKLRARLPKGVTVVAEELWQPTAATVGRLAWQAYQSGQRDDLWQLVPNYYRPSAAEEKLS